MAPETPPQPPTADSILHLVVPRRPGAELDVLRATLEAVPQLQKLQVVWYVPQERGDIVRCARDAAQAALSGGVVVAAGGDGTINAVAAAALQAGVPMGVLPMGTFNYFSREQGLALEAPDAVAELAHALQTGQMRPVQVGFVNRQLFLVNASVGLYPRLLADRERASRRFGRSRVVSVAAAIWSLLRPSAGRRWRVRIRAHDGARVQQQEHLVSTLFVGNNPLQLERMGLQQAQMVAEGGRLGVVMLAPQGRWAAAQTLWNAAAGRLNKDPAVRSLACAELSVEPASWKPPRVKVAFDGEREWMEPPLHFHISSRPLWLVAPAPLERDAAPQAGAVQDEGVPLAAMVPGLAAGTALGQDSGPVEPPGRPAAPQDPEPAHGPSVEGGAEPAPAPVPGADVPSGGLAPA